MNNTHIYITLLILLTAIKSNADDFRLFHDLKGREIEIQLLDYNPETNKAKVELRNKTIQSVDASIFSEVDQTYILKWHKTKVFRSESALRISAEMDVINSEKIKYRKATDSTKRWYALHKGMNVKDVVYQLELKNNSGVELNDLEIKYCVYYETTSKESTTTYETDPNRQNDDGTPVHYYAESYPTPKKRTVNTFMDTWKISALPDRKTAETLTKEVRLKSGKEATFNGDNEKNRDLQDDLLGIRIQIYANLGTENTLLKETSISTRKAPLPNWPTTEIN